MRAHVDQYSAAPQKPGQSDVSESELVGFLRGLAVRDDEFITYDNGYRGWTYSYREIAGMAGALGNRMRELGVKKGDRIMIWSESRPGWIAAFWACLVSGVVVVPVDPLSSIDLFRRIAQTVQAKLILLGNHVAGVGQELGATVWRLADLEEESAEPPSASLSLYAEDLAEIVFTSGTTAEPKGVLITHRNLAANLRPVDELIAPYRKYLRLLTPLRAINLLPMSHLFGQAAGLFVPPVIPASMVYIAGAGAQEIVRQIRSRKVAAIAAVPKLLEVLRSFVIARVPESTRPANVESPWPFRWWRARAVHRLFGWRFCCFVVGGAPLPREIEDFWAGLGFAVVQGYGLTETAPVISVSDPFDVRHGTTGKPLSGVEVKIADDGEILVRGDNVTPGYFRSPGQTAAAFRDGWFLTGDIGELDSEGQLIIRGRKKEMIVTAEGLNVFPEDVEAVLRGLQGVRDCAVIGRDRVHAVLVLKPGANAEAIVRQANQELEEHQKIRSFSVWTSGELPRTQATSKLRRAEIAERLQTAATEQAEKPESELAALVQKYAPGRTVTPDTTLDELGLSSLDRVELMMEVEKKLDTSIDEEAFASVVKVTDLDRPMPPHEPTHFPAYNRTWIARVIRRATLAAILLPFARLFARTKVSGLENLTSLEGQVMFAANHQSHMDTPVILASLPACWRNRIAVAMWKEYFDAHFFPAHHAWRERFVNSLIYGLVTLLFNAFPIPQTEASVRESLRYAGELVEEGWSILIFPEGERSLSGEIGEFHPGLGMLASRLHLTIVPIRLNGVGRVLPPSAAWPQVGEVEVRIGAPISYKGEPYPALVQKTADAVRGL
ncbi:MAG TPA: AMP-binding protein [Bryobacteraceae bacterium]|nr:AMP-binding protein [Bryobacteraceae bacterium]